MPELPLQSGTETSGGEALSKLEGTMAEWLAAIQTALSQEADRTIAGRGGSLCLPFRPGYVPSRVGTAQSGQGGLTRAEASDRSMLMISSDPR